MLGTNAGLIGAARTSRRGAAVGLWTPNEQVIYQRQNAWIGDASFDSVSLLLHMDGSNGNTTFTDSSKNALTVTANGNAQISTAQSKFGGASGAFDGAGDWLSGTQSFLVGTGDFTIEAWIYTSSVSGDQEVFCICDPSNNAASNILFEVNNGGAIRGSVRDGSGGVQLDITSSTSPILTNTWQHIAFVVSGSSGVLYVDGISKANGTISGSRSQNETAFRIGRLTAAIPRDFNGYIDDIRITKGVARYAANFTPPTAPFPNA